MSTNENQAKYDERVQRVMTAAANKEPDRVPLMPLMSSFAISLYGYTNADVMYNAQIGVDCAIKFMGEYPMLDVASGFSTNPGKGPLYEMMKPKALAWPGAPQPFIQIPDNSSHQFIEFPVLLEEEMEFFERDYTGWLFQYAMPKLTELMEPFGKWPTHTMGVNYDISGLAAQMTMPEMKNVIETLWKIDEMNKDIAKITGAGQAKLREMGFPSFGSGLGGAVPFDQYSDFFRGTIDSMMDLYERRDLIERFCEERIERNINAIRARAATLTEEDKATKWGHIILHKGMDKFLSDEQYDNLYWKHLQMMINEINACGFKCYVYTEGPYTTRIRNLKEVDKNMVVYHFEEVDLEYAKKELGDMACIAGAFPAWLCEQGTKQQVIDEVKRILDICAPGGGYIFEGGYGFGPAPKENIDAMIETVLEYGKY